MEIRHTHLGTQQAPDIVVPLNYLIDDIDIDWVSTLLGLDRLDGQRREFLTSLDTIDVTASPGSGKTALVVAKIAILAQKWDRAAQGICALSHTNVAREEIQLKLTQTIEGARLLHYPHYIDTIHGFVNRFLAIPWLSSHGYSITAIDNDIATAALRRLLGSGIYRVESFPTRRYRELSSVRIFSIDMSDPLRGSDFPAGPHSESYKLVTVALKKRILQGIFRHDEMLLFGEALLAQHPEVASVLRRRFPFVLLDEMQDTSASQAGILDLIFDPKYSGIVIQRVGDPNQAIYDDAESSGSSTFPDTQRSLITLSNSFRFDVSIATLAAGMAARPVALGGLVGVRRTQDARAFEHTIFVSPDDNVTRALPAYGDLVCRMFDDDVLERGPAVTAVGEVHRPKDDVLPGSSKYPGTVSHYWPGYSAVVTTRSVVPAALIDCIRKARAMVLAGHRVSEAIDVVASGVIGAVNRSAGSVVLRQGSRPHRSLSLALAGRDDLRRRYEDVLVRFVLDGVELTRQTWATLVGEFRKLVNSFVDSPSEVLTELLAWKSGGADYVLSASADPVNVFRAESDGRRIDIRVSSIHAVKGQTHLATLVVDTFNYELLFKTLLPWLTGARVGVPARTSERDVRRLRMAYVAMTRPSHLLCLALPQRSLGDGPERDDNVRKLQELGWTVVELD